MTSCRSLCGTPLRKWYTLPLWNAHISGQFLTLMICAEHAREGSHAPGDITVLCAQDGMIVMNAIKCVQKPNAGSSDVRLLSVSSEDLVTVGGGFSRIWGIPMLGPKKWQARNSRETWSLLWRFLTHPHSLQCLGKVDLTLFRGKSPSQACPAFGMTVGTREIGGRHDRDRMSSCDQGYKRHLLAEDSSSWNRWSAEPGRWPHVPAGPDPSRMKAAAKRSPAGACSARSQSFGDSTDRSPAGSHSPSKGRATLEQLQSPAGSHPSRDGLVANKIPAYRWPCSELSWVPTHRNYSESAMSSRAVSFERSGYSGQSSRLHWTVLLRTSLRARKGWFVLVTQLGHRPFGIWLPRLLWVTVQMHLGLHRTGWLRTLQVSVP